MSRLLAAYRRTDYEAEGAVARIGRRSAAVDALLRKHSRSFAAGKRPDDADVDALARPFGRRRQIW